MLGIYAKTFMTAARQRDLHNLPKKSWLEVDLPFFRFAGRRSGYHD